MGIRLAGGTKANNRLMAGSQKSSLVRREQHDLSYCSGSEAGNSCGLKS